MVHVGAEAETPFVLIIDQADTAMLNHLGDRITLLPSGEQIARRESLAAQIGARAILAFEGTIELSANHSLDGRETREEA